jgi:hypothetical protein
LTVFRSAELSRTKLAFADHPLVSVYIVLDTVLRTIALSKKETDNFVAAFGRLVDATVGEKFHCLANAVFVFPHTDPFGMEITSLQQRSQSRPIEAERPPREREDARQ